MRKCILPVAVGITDHRRRHSPVKEEIYNMCKQIYRRIRAYFLTHSFAHIIDDGMMFVLWGLLLSFVFIMVVSVPLMCVAVIRDPSATLGDGDQRFNHLCQGHRECADGQELVVANSPVRCTCATLHWPERSNEKE
jgi:hypothetical protein